MVINAAETRTIPAPAPEEASRAEMQQAMDADVARVDRSYDPNADYKVHHLNYRNCTPLNLAE